jgi:tetratricopeptide (TPR) repeat protein
VRANGAPRPARPDPEAGRPAAIRLEATPSSEEAFSVEDGDVLERALADAWRRAAGEALGEGGEGELPRAVPANPEPSGGAVGGVVQARQVTPSSAGAKPPAQADSGDTADSDEYLRLCAVLRAKGRFADATRLAREALAREGNTGPVLLELSRSELGLGRLDAAIEAALDAHWASRSTASLEHLLRLLTRARRFSVQDGDRLRRAVGRHPHQPLLLHAAGVYESLHGDPHEAEELLRRALRLEPREEARLEIAVDLARLKNGRVRTGGPDARSG